MWAEGPGVEPEGVTVKQKAYFTVHTEDAGDAKLDVKCIGPREWIIFSSLLAMHKDCVFM